MTKQKTKMQEILQALRKNSFINVGGTLYKQEEFCQNASLFVAPKRPLYTHVELDEFTSDLSRYLNNCSSFPREGLYSPWVKENIFHLGYIGTSEELGKHEITRVNFLEEAVISSPEEEDQEFVKAFPGTQRGPGSLKRCIHLFISPSRDIFMDILRGKLNYKENGFDTGIGIKVEDIKRYFPYQHFFEKRFMKGSKER